MFALLQKFSPLTICLLIILTACSSVQTGQQQSSAVSGLSSNLATVYFYRANNSPGSVVGVDLKDNGLDIGTLHDGTYFVWHTNPGRHALTSTTDPAPTQNFELHAVPISYMQPSVS